MARYILKSCRLFLLLTAVSAFLACSNSNSGLGDLNNSASDDSSESQVSILYPDAGQDITQSLEDFAVKVMTDNIDVEKLSISINGHKLTELFVVQAGGEQAVAPYKNLIGVLVDGDNEITVSYEFTETVQETVNFSFSSTPRILVKELSVTPTQGSMPNQVIESLRSAWVSANIESILEGVLPATLDPDAKGFTHTLTIPSFQSVANTPDFSITAIDANGVEAKADIIMSETPLASLFALQVDKTAVAALDKLLLSLANKYLVGNLDAAFSVSHSAHPGNSYTDNSIPDIQIADGDLALPALLQNIVGTQYNNSKLYVDDIVVGNLSVDNIEVIDSQGDESAPEDHRVFLDIHYAIDSLDIIVDMHAYAGDDSYIGNAASTLQYANAMVRVRVELIITNSKVQLRFVDADAGEKPIKVSLAAPIASASNCSLPACPEVAVLDANFTENFDEAAFIVIKNVNMLNKVSKVIKQEAINAIKNTTSNLEIVSPILPSFSIPVFGSMSLGLDAIFQSATEVYSDDTPTSIYVDIEGAVVSEGGILRNKSLGSYFDALDSEMILNQNLTAGADISLAISENGLNQLISKSFQADWLRERFEPKFINSSGVKVEDVSNGFKEYIEEHTGIAATALISFRVFQYSLPYLELHHSTSAEEVFATLYIPDLSIITFAGSTVVMNAKVDVAVGLKLVIDADNNLASLKVATDQLNVFMDEDDYVSVVGLPYADGYVATHRLTHLFFNFLLESIPQGTIDLGTFDWFGTSSVNDYELILQSMHVDDEGEYLVIGADVRDVTGTPINSGIEHGIIRVGIQ